MTSNKFSDAGDDISFVIESPDGKTILAPAQSYIRDTVYWDDAESVQTHIFRLRYRGELQSHEALQNLFMHAQDLGIERIVKMIEIANAN